jgi:hypothetical protein
MILNYHQSSIQEYGVRRIDFDLPDSHSRVHGSSGYVVVYLNLLFESQRTSADYYHLVSTDDDSVRRTP